MSEYQAELLAVEAKLAQDPDNEDLLSLKADLLEIIELSGGLEPEPAESSRSKPEPAAAASRLEPEPARAGKLQPESAGASKLDKDAGDKETAEVKLLAKKKEKNRKKKAKLREKIKEQLDIAESEKQSWQSFANKKGLKGVIKKSIFASPFSVTGKVGVGTNGIADAPSAASSVPHQSTSFARRKY